MGGKGSFLGLVWDQVNRVRVIILRLRLDLGFGCKIRALGP